MPIYQLSDELLFPPVSHAENGILAVGGDLNPDRLLLAYRSGIFPWFSKNEPIIWWSPDPRFVLFPQELKVSKSMEQVLRNKKFSVTWDTAFGEVIEACALQRRKGQEGTWITKKMAAAYSELFQMGYAHSVEVWMDGALSGGLYGVSLGRIFFGESMFFTVSNASKIAFISLVRSLDRRGFEMIDCQVETAHLASFGAVAIPRTEFMARLKAGIAHDTFRGSWSDWPQEPGEDTLSPTSGT